VLLSQATRELVAHDLPSRVSLRELGWHLLKDLAAPEHLWQLVIPGLQSEFPPLRTLDYHPHNLPLQLTALVGRERDVAAVRALIMRDDVRLVTLTGPGGVGKTRLALQSAAELVDHFADGAWLVPLARIVDATLVAFAMAQALGIREEAGRSPAECVSDQLRNKELLLLLDNFEQVVSVAPMVTALLTQCARVKVLVTSRAVLRLYGEHQYIVQPLELPGPDSPRSAEQLGHSPAVRLFVDRARASKPDFTLADQDAPIVAQICRHLDGLPLAIELAAARVSLLPPHALLARLERGLPLLIAGARDVPARHRTQHDAIAWSVDLLPAQQQRLFHRLAVFAGGCTIEAAVSVCDIDGDLGMEVLDGIAELADQSLVMRRVDAEGEPRFEMLKTIREYGIDRLQRSGEAAHIWRRYADYYMALADAAEPQLTGPLQAEWLTRLELDCDNVRAVLTWALAEGDASLALRLGGSIWRFWQKHGHISEGRDWLEQGLKRIAAGDSALRAKALIAAGELACAMGDIRNGIDWCQQALAAYESLGDLSGKACALHILGWALAWRAQSRVEYEQAARYQADCLALERQLGDRWGEAKALHELGEIARYLGDYRSALERLGAALQLRRELGDSEGIGWSLHCVAWTEYDQGNYQRALGLTTEALQTWQGLGHAPGLAATRNLRARIAGKLGDCEWAARQLQHSLQLWPKPRHREWLSFDLQVLAGLATQCGRGRRDAQRAARLLGAAEALRDDLPLALHRRGETDEIVRTIRAQLPECQLQRAWRSGHAMHTERVVAYARAIVNQLAGTSLRR
jgi:predicted ATPase